MTEKSVDNMAFSQNNISTIRFDDPVTLLSKQNKALLERSWAGYFAREIFPLINESRFSVLFCEERKGRYNTSVNYIVSMLILKELFKLTDNGIVQSVVYDLRFKYALNCTSAANSPVSAPSLARFRKKVAAYKKKTSVDLLDEEYTALSESIAKLVKRYRIKPAGNGKIAKILKETKMSKTQNKKF